MEYVFSNPVSILDPDWGNGGNKEHSQIIDFLDHYEWSSYLDSIGIKNFPSVTERILLWKIFSNSDDIFKGQRKVKDYTEEWIKYKKILLPKLSIE